MKLSEKLSQVTFKMKLALFISAFWFLFWVFAGYEGGTIVGGLAFGGVPLVLIWGFWMVATHTPKDLEAEFSEKMQDILNDGSKGKREYARLEYPPGKRPVLKSGNYELEIMDISAKGIKLLNDDQIELGHLIHGEAQLLSGQSIKVDGEVAWSLNNEVGLLMALIPTSIIAEEKRILTAKK